MGLTLTITLPVGSNLDNASLERIGNTTLELIESSQMSQSAGLISADSGLRCHQPKVHAGSGCQSGFYQFRNNLVSAKLVEEIKEHIFCIDTVRRAGSSSFDRAADVVETAMEDKVAEAPRTSCS
jgi:hypothetical protein